VAKKSKEAKSVEAQVEEQESFFEEGDEVETVSELTGSSIDDLWNQYKIQDPLWHKRTSKIQALVVDIERKSRGEGKGEVVRITLDNIRVLEGDETAPLDLNKYLDYTYKEGKACMWTYALGQFASCGVKGPKGVIGRDVIFEAAVVNFSAKKVIIGGKINTKVKDYQWETMMPTVVVEA